MVKRVQKYFEKYGPLVFQGVEVRAPKALGEIDYMTNRELIDLKVSSHQPNKTQTFQVPKFVTRRLVKIAVSED